MKRRRQARPTPPAARPAAARPLTDRLALLALWLLVLVPPLVFDPMAKDSFRLPKEVLSETLALVSLTLLCLRLRRTGELGWRRLSRHPAVQATVPLLAAAALAAAASAHPLHAREGLASLAIGAAALALWSLALRPDERRRLLAATAIPATVLSVIVILQFHRLWEPFAFVGGARQRQGLTSFAGGAFDLAAYLVLPLLVAQLGVSGARSRRTRWAWGLALVVGLYAMALTQTLTALAALIAASLVLWSRRLSSRRPERRRLLAAVAVLALLGGAIGLAVKPLRQRVASKAELLAAGKLNTVLTGRLDVRGPSLAGRRSGCLHHRVRGGQARPLATRRGVFPGTRRPPLRLGPQRGPGGGGRAGRSRPARRRLGPLRPGPGAGAQEPP
jgi:hypothetical protein